MRFSAGSPVRGVQAQSWKGLRGGDSQAGESVACVLVLREAESEAESRGAEVGQSGTAGLKLRATGTANGSCYLRRELFECTVTLLKAKLASSCDLTYIYVIIQLKRQQRVHQR